MKFHTSLSLALCSSALLLSQSALAGGQASIKIEQTAPGEPGVWTLLSENGTSRSSKDAGVNKLNYSFGLTDFGQTTLSVVAPAGNSVKITVYRGGDLMETVTAQQYSFALLNNDNYRFVIQYALTKLGSLGVTSNPSGLHFRLKGPTSRILNAKTPFTFENIPAGQYSVIMAGTATCAAPAPHSVIVQPEERNTAVMTLNCNVKVDTAVDTTSRKSKRTLVEEAQEREFKPRGQRK
jgi:hypothetical protein